MENEIQNNLSSANEVDEELEIEGYSTCYTSGAMCFHDCFWSTSIFSESD
ncbi:hypothetical protein [Paenibacillus pseudetheri]|uniref:Lantibiotic n=1 Tax=Paenibacillus pseudetheri TaxID=2897682 RepID=A0ABN8FT05_9BACL|nr:hypothetical protein [Paenibacillus pseudetheri]CAH1059045.1 hypothetical protein PAECIP111894_05231 [Paenibacillus pseudetheri]